MRSAVGGRLLSGLRIALDVLTVRLAVLLPAALEVTFFGAGFLLAAFLAVDFLAAALFGAVLAVFLLDVFLVILFSPWRQSTAKLCRRHV
jgi:mannose/fructose/N-acetylgalactosamine-specific phosphotransferase system component IIC